MRETVKPWPVLASRTLFSHPRLTILEDTVLLPSGHQTTWLRFPDSRDVVAIICLNHEKQILVAYQYNAGPRQVVDEFPGGGVATNESYLEGARRELLEEVGIYAHEFQEIGAFLVNNRRWSGRCRVFVATQIETRQAAPDAEEFISYEWLSVEQIEQQIRDGVLENGTLLAAWTLFRLNYRP
ncbi:MAG TPA: NUDIX hydrolase [Anaerolineae bacterium]|nr:NUDIX hydrolase [Anaerolineae bacterium]